MKNNYNSGLLAKIEKKTEFKTSTDSLSALRIETQVFLQGERTVFRAVLSFEEVNKLCSSYNFGLNNSTTQSEKSVQTKGIQSEQVNQITEYILANKDSVVLPTLTAMTKGDLVFEPQQADYSPSNFNLQNELRRKRRGINGVLIFNATSQCNQPINVIEGIEQLEAINNLQKLLKPQELDELFIGLDIHVIQPKDDLRNIYVQLHNRISVDSNLVNLFFSKDSLSGVVRELVGINTKQHALTFLLDDNNDYIGFELLNNIGVKSKAVFSQNMLRNIIGWIAMGSPDQYKKFESTFPLKSPSYVDLVSDISLFWKEYLNNTTPFTLIKGDLDKIIQLRTEYINLSAAGLYVAANIAHYGRKHNLHMGQLGKMLSEIDWKREVVVGEKKELNPLFKGGILYEKGVVVSTKNAIKHTTEKLLSYLSN